MLALMANLQACPTLPLLTKHGLADRISTDTRFPHLVDIIELLDADRV